MDYDEFLLSLDADMPPLGVHVALRGLWYDAKGMAESADRAVANDSSFATTRVRAYLARKRGDVNATAKWYWHCGTKPSQESLPVEWEDIVRNLLIQAVVESAYQ